MANGWADTMKIENESHRMEVHKADLSGSKFDDVNLSGSDFRNINMSGCSFDDLNMSGWRIQNPESLPDCGSRMRTSLTHRSLMLA